MSCSSQITLSLSDQCHLYLILHLEEFLPEELALLSLRMRERLLINLPVADICRLEETTVVQGIDTNFILREVGKRQVHDYCYDLVCNSTLKALEQHEGYRDHFHEVASHYLIWKRYCGRDLPLLLYSVRECLGFQDLYWQSRKGAPVQVVEGHVAIVPPRYAPYLDSNCPTSYELMLLACFKRFPRKLTTGRYKPQYACGDESTLNLLLSEVEEFDFGSCPTTSETLCGLLRKDTPQMSIANTFIQCSGSKLNSVHVNLITSYDPKSNDCGWNGEVSQRSYVPQKGECLPRSTFVHLEKIDVNLPISSVFNLDLILDDIHQAISYVRPGELRLGMVYPCNEDLQPFVTGLLSILTTFVCRKTFRKLILNLRTYELYDKLIAPFAHAPPVPLQMKQCIEFHNQTFLSAEEGEKVPLRPQSLSVTAPQQRSITFYDCSPVSKSFQKKLESLGIELQVVNSDLRKLIQKQLESHSRRTRKRKHNSEGDDGQWRCRI